VGACGTSLVQHRPQYLVAYVLSSELSPKKDLPPPRWPQFRADSFRRIGAPDPQIPALFSHSSNPPRNLLTLLKDLSPRNVIAFSGSRTQNPFFQGPSFIHAKTPRGVFGPTKSRVRQSFSIFFRHGRTVFQGLFSFPNSTGPSLNPTS